MIRKATIKDVKVIHQLLVDYGKQEELLARPLSELYDHVRDFTLGDVQAEGIDITYLNLVHEEIFYRFINFREWDVSEISFAKYVSLISQGDDSIIAIPVFPSRIFRLSSIYVRDDGPIRRPEDVTGCRVGLPEWAQTAAVYTRGYLMHHAGVGLQEVDWYQAETRRFAASGL